MSQISEMFMNEEIKMSIHLDEMQDYPEMAQAILHVIGSYICSTSDTQSSPSVLHKINVFPIVTGTSSKSFKVYFFLFSNIKVKFRIK